MIHWIQIGVILFVVINGLLIYKDNEGKVNRLAYINEWEESTTADMREELLKKAVLAPKEEMPIYFSDNQGIFQEFLVGVGDEVTVGQDLFIYQVQNYYQAEAEFLSEVERINGAITAAEQAMAEVEAVTFVQNEFVPPIVEEFSITVEVPASSMEAEFMKRQFIAEKKKEITQLNAEREAVNSQLQSLQSTGDTITYISPYAGRVNNLSDELASPLLTIESFDLQAETSLTEQERAIVEEGMLAEVRVNAVDETLTAYVDELADVPDKVSVRGESKYDLIAALAEPEAEDAVEVVEEVEEEEELELGDYENESTLLPGYHGTLAIILEERLGVTAIDRAHLIDGAVWRMNKEGQLIELIVDTGFEENGQIEVIGDLAPGELIAIAPESQLRDRAYFITPLKWSELRQESLNKETVDWKRGILGGLIMR
ncbi:efflux RND transporter periplasmic adaptor subunit [Oceanobacillus sp. CAU 1775]